MLGRTLTYWIFGVGAEEGGEYWYTRDSSPTKHIIDGGSFYDPETFAMTFCRIEHRYRHFHLIDAPVDGSNRCKGCWAVSEVRNDVRWFVGRCLQAIDQAYR